MPRNAHTSSGGITFSDKTYFTPRLNLTLYSLLLILTPFLLLQNYMQDAVGLFSELSFSLAGIKIPYLVLAGLILAGVLVLINRKQITLKKILVWFLIIILWLAGQQISDIFIDHPFYQLQNNWHYIAYGIFAFLAWQHLKTTTKSNAEIIFRTYLMAMLISTFDEAAQIVLSQRVFDVSDIAKDLLGVFLGILFINFIYTDNGISFKGQSFYAEKLKDYRNNPIALMVLLLLFTFILLFVSSILTEKHYVLHIVIITLIHFGILFLLIHYSRKHKGRIVILISTAVIVLGLLISFSCNYKRNITHHSNGFVVYKGLPLLFFDFIIFENGTFRFIDKKNSYNQADLAYLLKRSSDILLIGRQESNQAFISNLENLESQFIFNIFTKQPLQVILLPTAEACEVFNRLKMENKKVVFVVHNTQ